ncbi:MAG: phage holin family protein [Chloroflexota bacterium]
MKIRQFLGDLYGTQLSLLWRWRPGRRALLRRLVLSFIVSVIAFVATAWLLPQLQVDGLWGAMAAILFLAAFNLLLRPVLLALIVRWSVIVLAILTILIQAVAIWLLDPFVPAVNVDGGFIGALIVSFVFGFILAAISTVVGLGEDDSYYGALMRSLVGRQEGINRTDQPGIVIIQVDGLSHDVASGAMRAGRVPTMSSWVRSGSHRLAHWNALLPSTTPASQAGILHGNNDGIPNFRWWEKKTKRLLVANHPEDATVIEARISNREGLLSPGGASISNIFTGDADRAFLVMSTIKVKERGLGQSQAFAWFFVSPYNYLSMMARYVAEVVKENIQSRRQSRAGIVPRMHRGFPYPWVRAATNVALRALGTSLVIQEMVRGTSVIYMDYTDYDEIAHHSGPERPESLDALDGVDRELRTLAKAAEDAPRPYRFVVLADHGQSLGETFLQKYGTTLQEVVRSLMGGSASVAAATSQVEDWGQLNAFLTELTRTKGMTGAIARAATRNKRDGGTVDVGPSQLEVTPQGAWGPTERTGTHAAATADEGEAPADLIVVAGGNLALVYFNDSDERMTLEEIEAAYPDLVQALASHPGVGVVLVRSGERGLLAVGHRGIRALDDDQVEGEDPLAIYGEHAAAAVRRIDSIANVGDLVVISTYDPETGEIHAFEELIGAHGGLGGAQTRPFLLHPAEWEVDLAPLVGAPMVYQQLRRWMEGELGMAFGPTAPTAPTAAASTGPTGEATASVDGVPAATG